MATPYNYNIIMVTEAVHVEKEDKVWKLKHPCSLFERKYDLIQQQLEDISATDNLLSG
jgi:hypothetical protein